jgi:hypothetical protein
LKKGEITENFTILTDEEWIAHHYKDNEEEMEKNSNKKIGGNQNKREYKFKVY